MDTYNACIILPKGMSYGELIKFSFPLSALSPHRTANQVQDSKQLKTRIQDI